MGFQDHEKQLHKKSLVRCVAAKEKPPRTESQRVSLALLEMGGNQRHAANGSKGYHHPLAHSALLQEDIGSSTHYCVRTYPATH